MALTATADKTTQDDIVDQLSIPNANRHLASFNRPNLYLDVKPAQDRIKHILEFLEERPFESGIIYCLSRKSTEAIAEKLRNAGFNTKAYHAGMSFRRAIIGARRIYYGQSTDHCSHHCIWYGYRQK